MNTGIIGSSYISFLIIPLGVLLYIIMKIASDVAIINKKITINRNESNTILDIKQEKEIADAILANQKITTSRFMIESLPLKLNELEFKTSISNIARPDDKLASQNKYLGMLLESSGACILHEDMIYFKNSEKSYLKFAKRVMYDEFLYQKPLTSEEVKKMKNSESEKDIITVSRMTLETLKYFKQDQIKMIFSFSKFDRLIFENSKTLFVKGNLEFLFLSLNGFIEVINC